MTDPSSLRVLPARFAPPASGLRDHDVFVGASILGRAGEWMRAALPDARRLHCIVDAAVDTLYAPGVYASLQDAGFAVTRSVLTAGERAKTWETAGRLHEAVLDARLDRHDAIVGIGGGVTTDLAGFVAATYLRGIAVVHVPTTLLAQVDAALGGKTGVNLPRGKNLAGAFHQPRAVVADVATVASLPAREFLAGLAEVIKTAVILDAALFADLEAVADVAALQLDQPALVDLVARTAAHKLAIVTRDETEAGNRALLNFGHTVGHALEAATGYSRFLHGEAVAIGMVAATRLSEATGHAPAGTAERLHDVLARAGLPTAASAVRAAEVLDKLQYDKKMKGGQGRFVLTRGIGSATVATALPDEIVLSCVESVLR